ncbi:hypothetical protein FB451DRAFT_1469161 [Mycena latifolia]|nr:hypothetical protein FB451DRAFT_1469161 [Mycena latifolia]
MLKTDFLLRQPLFKQTSYRFLDKGLVSTKVKMHPILLRGCWINSATWNGSGDGGSALVGFVKMPDNIHQIDPRTLKSSARAEYDRIKRLIYCGVCETAMASLQHCSHCGEALRFGDGIIRVAHPRASTSSKTQRNNFLKACGLHDFERLGLTRDSAFPVVFAYSDPYEATGYDCLHFFDGGIWGRTMWVLLKGYLQTNELATDFNENMDKFPRWRDLHFSSPTTIDYSDGQTFLDILKILPANSCLVKLVRTMQKVRIMLGLEVTTASRLELLCKMITKYEQACKACRPFIPRYGWLFGLMQDVSEQHDKSLNFLKQHFLSHAAQNFRAKGTSRNMNTRVGEGFQQEVAAQYKKTNGKNAEHQISIMDENEETMARIQMAVDGWLKSQEEDEQDPVLGPSNIESPAHWKLGSADPQITTVRLGAVGQSNPSFRDFNLMLREYLARHHPSHVVHPDQDIQIEPCKVLYVDYQSKVDWKLARDILRCNPCFHARSRYDSIIYESQDNDLAMGRLELVFCCHLPQKVTLDLAMIRPYCRSSWAARTRTDCPIREWGVGSTFIALEHVTRGVLLCPIFEASREVFYVVDCIDEDITSTVSREREPLRDSQAVQTRLKPVITLRHFERLGTGSKPPRQWLGTGCNPTQADMPTQSVPTDLGFFRHTDSPLTQTIRLMAKTTLLYGQGFKMPRLCLSGFSIFVYMPRSSKLSHSLPYHQARYHDRGHVTVIVLSPEPPSCVDICKVFARTVGGVRAGHVYVTFRAVPRSFVPLSALRGCPLERP